jgi:hypothetical protein
MNIYISAYVRSLTTIHVTGLHIYASLCESTVISVQLAVPSLESDLIMQLRMQITDHSVGAAQ